MTTITEVTKQLIGDQKTSEVARESTAAPQAGGSAQAPLNHGNSSVDLSTSVQNALDEGSFDEAKVTALKDAILEGNYPLDPRRIAENMAALERLIG